MLNSIKRGLVGRRIQAACFAASLAGLAGVTWFNFSQNDSLQYQAAEYQATEYQAAGPALAPSSESLNVMRAHFVEFPAADESHQPPAEFPAADESHQPPALEQNSTPAQAPIPGQASIPAPTATPTAYETASDPKPRQAASPLAIEEADSFPQSPTAASEQTAALADHPATFGLPTDLDTVSKPLASDVPAASSPSETAAATPSDAQPRADDLVREVAVPAPPSKPLQLAAAGTLSEAITVPQPAAKPNPEGVPLPRSRPQLAARVINLEDKEGHNSVSVSRGAKTTEPSRPAQQPIPRPVLRKAQPTPKQSPRQVPRQVAAGGESTLRVQPGDTLMQLLTKAGVPTAEADAAIKAMSAHYNPRRIKPGQAIHMTFAKAEPHQLLAFRLRPDPETDIEVWRDDSEGFLAATVERPLVTKITANYGTIRSSLAEAGRAAGVPAEVMLALIRNFSFSIDFQREVQKGDAFEVLYAKLKDEDGKTVKNLPPLYAALTVGGRRLAYYRHTLADGRVGLFDAEGRSTRKSLMRTPIDGARVSSGFGKRRHPILGYSKMHRGVDFAASRGTPIYAAGDGIVIRRGRNGSYGHYIRIRHNSTYQTAYAHLSRYARGIKKGKRVRQGQVIGYVGSTGRSTGPHLHYEILVNGRQVDPRRLKLPNGRSLEGEELARFHSTRRKIDQLREANLPAALLASRQ